MTKITTTLVALTLAVAACAKAPEDIVAIPTTGNFNCAYEATNLILLEAEQTKARKNDTLGVLLIGVPVASLQGKDLELEVAVAKGRLEACDE